MTATRSEIIGRLLELPAEVAEREHAMLTARARLTTAKGKLETTEALLLLDVERTNGKNAEMRAAQVLLATVAERQEVEAAAEWLGMMERDVRRSQNELSALRAAARLLAGPDS